MVECELYHNPADIILTLSIIFGIVLSYLPQHLRIVKLKNSEGISPWYLLLGGLASFSNLANVAILQAPYLSCCTFVGKGQCLANLLGFFQMFIQWLMFHIIFILYFTMYPERLKYQQSSDNLLTESWSFSLKIKQILKIYSFLLLLMIFSMAMIAGFPSPVSNAIAWILGIFSMILSVFQFIPQIHQTFKHKEIGALSIPTMLIQTPGSFIFCYTLALSPGINASTWLTYLVTGCLQGILLSICLYYQYFEKTPQYNYVYPGLVASLYHWNCLAQFWLISGIIMNFKTVNENDESKVVKDSASIDELPIKIEKFELNYNEEDLSIGEASSFFTCSSSSSFSPFSSFESCATTSYEDTGSSTLLSRIGSQSALSGRTVLVHLAPEEQIERDLATEEQLARIRKEIEEMEVKVTANKNETELRRRKSRKDLVKVPIESGLPVALHSKETGKEKDSTACGTEEADVIEEQGQQFGGMRIVNEDHRNYILMYDMLTGIRISVSRCQAKPSRPLTTKDFYSTHKMAFDLTGNEETPSSRYDFKFKDYAPWVFRSLREQFSIDAADYLVSLTGKYVLSELYSPGKSGSLFYYSQDYRFIIKTIRESEHLFLRKILRHYHQHIQDNSNSLLVRFYGLHRVQLPMGRKIYFVVMGNLFPSDRPMRSIYDLKGSTHGRWNEEPTTTEASNLKGPGPVVLKDLNWLKRKEKLVLGPVKATQFMNQLKIDCKFLAKLKIMDYSLLIGLHTLSETEINENDGQFLFYKDFNGFQSSYEDDSAGPEVYYLGVIDILTPYSLSKKMEHTFKSLVFPKDSISAVNPSDYARRFLKFMSDNILQNVGADYSRRGLPKVPEAEDLGVECDGFICIEGEQEQRDDL